MKYRNLILSVLFWATASVSMAVTLPSSSYSSFVFDDDATAYTISTGTTFVNHSLSSGSVTDWGCTKEEGDEYSTSCWTCCTEKTKTTDPTNPDNIDCMQQCQGTHLGSLDASVAVLLSMILSYAGFMYYRRRKEYAEQA
ncbi:MAG: hypothetical protein IKJ22_04400 [Paludibacteraceae bacterium]|nr:hypothetical protein [Paludibacteraceae bacterium]